MSIYSQIQRADVNAYGQGSERSIPKLSFILEPKSGCKTRLYHEMKLKGATEPSLSLYLSCSPALFGMVNVEVVFFISTIVNVVYTCKHVMGIKKYTLANV